MVWQLVPLNAATDEAFKLPEEGVVTIGRRPNCSIVCQDISVSGKHCEVVCEGTLGQRVLMLVDCSSNGTYINDERITKGDKAQLHDGDVVSLSKPHPPGANDGTVDPPPLRVQYRVDFQPCSRAAESPADAMSEERVPPTPARGASLSPMPSATPADALRRLATTAEGYAQDLLVQEQLCKAKITGELLLARRKLDEERNKSESLARDLQKSKATLEEERNKKTAAQVSRESLRTELSKLKDCQLKLRETQAAHASLQEKQDRTEVEAITQAQKETSLELVVQRLQEELGAMHSSNSSSQEKLAVAQEQLRATHEDVSRLEGLVAETSVTAADAQKESDRLQRELAAERSKKEGLEDQQVLTSGEIERAERGGSSSKDLLAQANMEIEELEARISSSRQEADTERASSDRAKSKHVAASKKNDQLKEAAVRFADTLHSLVDKWVHGLPDVGLVASEQAFPAHMPAQLIKTDSLTAPGGRASGSNTTGSVAPPAAVCEGDAAMLRRVEAGAADSAVRATLAASRSEACKEGENSPAEEEDFHKTMHTRDSSRTAALRTVPASSVPAVATAALLPAAAIAWPATPGPPQRMWSVSLLGATEGVQESPVGSDASDQDESPISKRRRISTGSATTASPA